MKRGAKEGLDKGKGRGRGGCVGNEMKAERKVKKQGKLILWVVSFFLFYYLVSATSVGTSEKGLLVEQWRYPLQSRFPWGWFGSSAAIANLDSDPKLEIITGSDEYCNFYPELGQYACGIWRVFYFNGVIKWARSTGTDEARSSPVVIDLNGDGIYEIAAGTTSGYFVEVMDSLGHFVWTFPKLPPFPVGGPFVWPGSPAAADLLPDVSGIELVIGNRVDGKLYVFDGDNSDQKDEGETVTTLSWYSGDIGKDGKDWDVLWIFTPPEGCGENGIVSTPAIADLDGDGKLEVIVASTNGYLYVLSNRGELLTKFRTNGPLYASPAVADIDNDKIKEIIIGSTDGNIYLFKWSRSSVTTKSWSPETRSPFYSSPAVGDVDGDGALEIIAASTDGNIYILNNQLALKRKLIIGSPLLSSPALARRGSNGLGIYIGADDGYLYLFDGATGTCLDWFCTAGAIRTSPSIADIDGDGRLEIVFYDWGNVFWCIEDKDSRCEPYAPEWPMFRAGPTRTGTYERLGCIKGKVTDTAGKGIRGAQVTASSQITASTSTDENGQYLLYLPPGTYNVTASSSGYEPKTESNIVVQPGKARELNFSLKPAPITLTGKVKTKEGKGIAEAWVGVVGKSGEDLIANLTRTDQNGKFELALCPGTYTIHVLAMGYKPVITGYSLMGSFEVNITLEPGDTLAGKAVLYALSLAGAPYLWGGKGRHWDPEAGYRGGQARWATPLEIRETAYFWRQADTARRGLDCTGLVMWAYSVAYNPDSDYHALFSSEGDYDAKIMTEIKTFTPTKTISLYEQCLNWFKEEGYHILQPGDIIYFKSETKYENHAVLYIGGGYIVHASGDPKHNAVVYERLAEALNRYKDRGLNHTKITVARMKPEYCPQPGPFFTVNINEIDFFNVPVNKTVDKILTITNMSSTKLNLRLSLPERCPFSIELQQIELQPLESQEITITFKPTALQNYQCKLTLQVQNKSKTVTLIGVGKKEGEPALQITSEALAFGVLSFGWIKVGESKELYLKVTNIGSGDLGKVTCTCKNKSFSCRTEGDRITISFTPQKSGIALGYIQVSTQNGDTATVLACGQGESASSQKMLNEIIDYHLDVTVLPNPVRHFGSATFSVKGANVEAIQVKIYDLSGRLVWEGESEGDSLVWHTEDLTGLPLANGVYFYIVLVRVADAWVATPVQKIVILR